MSFQFKRGDRVILHNMNGISQPINKQNPLFLDNQFGNVIGTIVCIIRYNEKFDIMVSWDNGERNDYNDYNIKRYRGDIYNYLPDELFTIDYR